MNKFLHFFILIVPFLATGQEVITKAKNMIVENKKSNNGVLMTYKLDQKMIAGSKCNFEENTAEQVFCAFFNLNSEVQLADFFGENEIPTTYSKEDYISTKKIYFEKSETNYYVLESKFVLENYDNSKDIYIKYINYNDEFQKPVYSIFFLKEIGGRYMVSDLGQNFKNGLFLISTKSSIFYDLFTGILTEDKREILSAYISENKLNLSSLIDEYFKLAKSNKNHPLYKLLHDDEFSIF